MSEDLKMNVDSEVNEGGEETVEAPKGLFTSVENGSICMDEVKLKVSWHMDRITISFVQAALKGEKLENPLTYASVACDCTAIPESIYISCRSAQHGIEQKMRDSLAMTKDARSATVVSEAVSILQDLWVSALLTGDWTKKGEGRSSLTAKLNATWTNASEEERALLVRMKMFTPEGVLIKK